MRNCLNLVNLLEEPKAQFEIGDSPSTPHNLSVLCSTKTTLRFLQIQKVTHTCKRNLLWILGNADTHYSYAKTHIYHRRHVICLTNFHLVVGGQSWERGIRIVLKYPITKCIVLGKIHDAMPGCLQAGWCLHTHTLYSSDLTN